MIHKKFLTTLLTKLDLGLWGSWVFWVVLVGLCVGVWLDCGGVNWHDVGNGLVVLMMIVMPLLLLLGGMWR
jgi:hypothetical protein